MLAENFDTISVVENEIRKPLSGIFIVALKNKELTSFNEAGTKQRPIIKI